MPTSAELPCTAPPSGAPLALGWPTDPGRTVLVDLSDIARPQTLCTLDTGYSVVRFYSPTEISYETPDGGTPSRLVRTNIPTKVTQTFVTSDAGMVAWDWSSDGKTLAYFAGNQLWLQTGGRAATRLASYQLQPGRGGGWSDEIEIRFSPSGKYFVAVHTVTIPLTFEIRRASDGGLVWSSPTPNYGTPGLATMAVWSKHTDRLYFQGPNGIEAWDPPGTVITLVPGLTWTKPSISPDEHAIAYTVLDTATFHLRVEVLDLQTLQVRVIALDRWNATFASDQLLLYGRSDVQMVATGTLAYDLRTGVETELPFDILLDVWPSTGQ